MYLPRLFATVLAAALVSSVALADPITYQQALDRAQTQAPGLKAAALQVDAARASVKAAGVLPDPRLSFGLDNFPISGPPAGRFGADEMTMARIGIAQDLPSRAMRRAERSKAGAEIDVAAAQVPVEDRRVRVAAALAWIDLYFANRRVDAIEGVLASLNPLWSTEPSGVASGALRPAEALSPVRMRAQLLDERDELVAAQGRARAELVRWTGDPSVTVMGDPPAVDMDFSKLRGEVERHPSLIAYVAEAQRAQTELDIARAAKKPDWSVEASYGRRDPMFGDMVSAGVSVRIPLRTARLQEPLIAARRIELSRIATQREETRRGLIAQFDADTADHLMHHAQWQRSHDLVLPTALKQADLETASYAAGRASLADVIAAFIGVAEARLQTLEREAAVARDAVRIGLTYGSDKP